ncbi:MAG: HD-GYP domain-containing protein [Deferrisomatales bacterium]
MKGSPGRPAAEALVRALAALLRAQGLYPPGHAVTRRARAAAAGALAAIAGDQEIVLGVADGYLVVDEVAFLRGDDHAQELVRWLGRKAVEGVALTPGATAEELERFGAWLRADGPEPWLGGGGVRVVDLDREARAWRRGRRAYQTALTALDGAYREAEQGLIPDPDPAHQCVAAFSALLEESPAVVRGLALLKDYDQYTFHHSVHVCLLSLGVGRGVGLGPEALGALGVGALLHDIGKTRTPAAVVRKPGGLSTLEWALMHRHPEHGQHILRQMEGMPDAATRVVYEHHLRVDGRGYPEVPPGYRQGELSPLVAVADVYDAMTTHRSYCAPSPLPAAVRRLQELRGSHLWPGAVDAFVAFVGPLPVGSLVRLRSGEVAVVSRIGGAGQVVEVRVVVGADGAPVPEGQARSRPASDPEVVGWVDPLAHGVDPAAVLRGDR